MSFLNKLINNQDLSFDEMSALMQNIMTGKYTPAQIAGYLIALRCKGETVTELTASVQVMRSLASQVDVKLEDQEYLIDTCGTGGDGSQTFNISTTSAIVASSVGVKIAKHGNRSVSSKSGSADVLESLGISVNLTHEQISNSIHEIGIGFMFAPNHHPAMKYAGPVRKELGVRTLFNLIGPLTNPANAKRQILGVFDSQWVRPLAEVLKELGSEHVMVVHGSDKLDEISISGETFVAELLNGEINEYKLIPEVLGLERGCLDDLRVSSIEESKEILLNILQNKVETQKQKSAKNIVLANAGAGIYVSGLAQSIIEGIEMAQFAIESGKAFEKFNQLKNFNI